MQFLDNANKANLSIPNEACNVRISTLRVAFIFTIGLQLFRLDRPRSGPIKQIIPFLVSLSILLFASQFAGMVLYMRQLCPKLYVHLTARSASACKGSQKAYALYF